MNTTVKLQNTTNYDLFELHEYNRNIKEKPTLLASMKKYGFMPSGAIHCVISKSGKLQVIRGHHRLMYAKRLGLPVWYIVDHLCEDIFTLEGIENQQWDNHNFVQAYAKAGSEDYVVLDEFRRKHGINLNIASSLVGGESALSCNKVNSLKRGNFKVGDMKHANQVVSITGVLRACGVPFATTSSLVGAISAALRCEDVDFDKLLSQCRKYYHTLNKRATREEYLDELESMYNYRNRGVLLPLKMKAVETMRKRRNLKRFPKNNRGA